MRKIYFVGEHNKPGLAPLDGSTKSGRTIDQLIARIYLPTKKTNLCDTEKQVTDPPAIRAHGTNWWKIHGPVNGDIIVLLGGYVGVNFVRPENRVYYVRIKHPAAIFGLDNKMAYIQEALTKIKQCLTPGELGEQYKWELANGWEKY